MGTKGVFNKQMKVCTVYIASIQYAVYSIYETQRILTLLSSALSSATVVSAASNFHPSIHSSPTAGTTTTTTSSTNEKKNFYLYTFRSNSIQDFPPRPLFRHTHTCSHEKES